MMEFDTINPFRNHNVRDVASVSCSFDVLMCGICLNRMSDFSQ